MEWNLKNPLQWDWENLALFTVKESEISKSTEQSVLRAECEVISNGSVYSSDSGTCSGSELGNGSSRNSISPSVGSLSKVGNKISEVNVEPVEGFLENQIKNNEVVQGKGPRTSPVMVGYVGTEEPPIGLKLGKRTYFENMGSVNIKTSSSVSMMPSATSVKRSKASQLVIQHSHCQVEGCNIDLIGAKYYHRKHKVCESHSKSPRVIVAGHECRFCQQCSRFHDLSEFDQKKRSCRRRLSDHNARRRKPQPETISFNSSMLSSPFYDGRQQMNFSLNLARVNHVRPASSFWNDSHGFNISMAKGSWLKPTKVDVDGQLQLPVTDFSNILIASRDDFDRLMPFKFPITEVLNQGQEASLSASASDLNGAGDLQRALSLLSNDSWGPSRTAQSNMIQFAGTNLPTASQPPVQVVKSTHECWEDVHSLAEQALTFNLHGNGSHVQEFHLGKATYESPFFEASQVFSKSDSHFLEFKT